MSATFSEIRLEIYRQEIVEAQRIVAWIALREVWYCEADMAGYLGITTSCIYRSDPPGKRPKVTVCLKQFCTFCTNVPYCVYRKQRQKHFLNHQNNVTKQSYIPSVFMFVVHYLSHAYTHSHLPKPQNEQVKLSSLLLKLYSSFKICSNS